MVREMLKLIPYLDPSIAVSYAHYGNTAGNGNDLLTEALDGTTCVVGMNLQIEVHWDRSLALARWCKCSSVPLYNYVHDYWGHHREGLASLVDREGVLLAASSPFIVAALAADGFASTYVPMGAQLPATRPPAYRTSKTVVASVGRLVRRKRFPDIIRAFCRAELGAAASLNLTLLPSCVFDQHVDAEQLRLVETEIEAARIDRNLIKLGHSPTVPPDYSSMSIYICASDYEGFSMTPYEAAYSGCPPIVSDIPPHRFMADALFEGRSREFLYPVADTDALASRLADEAATGRRRAYLLFNQNRICHLIEEQYSLRATALALVQLCHRTQTRARSSLTLKGATM